MVLSPLTLIILSRLSSICFSCFGVIITPFSAKAITGFIISSIDNFPNFLCTSNNPAIVPGTPTDNAPFTDKFGITFPFSSKYIFFEAFIGAFSR